MNHKQLKDLSDEQVVEYVRQKDQEAYEELVKRYQQPLLRYANYLISDPDKAADAAQNGQEKAFQDKDQGYTAFLHADGPHGPDFLYSFIHDHAEGIQDTDQNDDEEDDDNDKDKRHDSVFDRLKDIHEIVDIADLIFNAFPFFALDIGLHLYPDAFFVFHAGFGFPFKDLGRCGQRCT